MSPEDSREVVTLRRLHHLMNQVNARQDLHEVLQTVVDGVVDVVGFRVAAISYRHPDDNLEVLAVAGHEAAREQLLGTRTPLAEITDEFAIADDWGILRFVPHERLSVEQGVGWIPDVQPLDVPNAWHPEDALYAPLSAPTGEMIGLLSVDLPHDGRRPGQFQREVLEMYAVQAGIAIDNARQRVLLDERHRLDTAVRSIVRTAGQVLDLGRVIDGSVEPVVSGLRCHGLWIRAFEGEGERPGVGRGAIYPGTVSVDPTDALLHVARRTATACWADQRAAIVTESAVQPDGVMTRGEVRLLLDFVGQIGSRSLLLVPLGAGYECLGYMALTRTAEAASWSDEEVDAALEIGRDIGRAVLHARLFEREREIVEELQDLDRYKTELISTISHELKNPLTAIVGHVEILQAPVAGDRAERSLAAIERSVARLRNLVEDLLLLSKVADPDRTLIPVPVDMAQVVSDAVELFQLSAEQQGVTIQQVGVDGAVLGWGDPAELDRVVTNLVGNAVKFSPAGGTVTLQLDADDEQVTFLCSDEGLGISPEDQEQLFTEFYRSSNPAALDIPGTGLGLTIVKRIVDRHRGSITVRSAIGEGSTFKVAFQGPPMASVSPRPGGRSQSRPR